MSESSRMRKIRWGRTVFLLSSPFFPSSLFWHSLTSTKSTKSLLESRCFCIRWFLKCSFWYFQTCRPLRRVQHLWFTTWFWYQLAWCCSLCVDGYSVGRLSISSEAIQSSISFSLATREYSSFPVLLISLLRNDLGHANDSIKEKLNSSNINQEFRKLEKSVSRLTL